MENQNQERKSAEHAGRRNTRAMFAAHALGAMLADPEMDHNVQALAERAWNYADAMMAGELASLGWEEALAVTSPVFRQDVEPSIEPIETTCARCGSSVRVNPLAAADSRVRALERSHSDLVVRIHKAVIKIREFAPYSPEKRTIVEAVTDILEGR